MTDRTKKDELDEQELDQIQGGMNIGVGELQECIVKKQPARSGDLQRPETKKMERVFEDE